MDAREPHSPSEQAREPRPPDADRTPANKAPSSASNAPSPRESLTSPESLATLERMEALLSELRGTVDEIARERWRRELTPTRVIAAIVQVLVVGLMILAGLDWAFQNPGSGLMTKLSFAATLQLIALTAFVVSREGG